MDAIYSIDNDEDLSKAILNILKRNCNEKIQSDDRC